VGLDLVQIMNDLLMTWWLKSSSAATGVFIYILFVNSNAVSNFMKIGQVGESLQR
jgi:hypothetical protein